MACQTRMEKMSDHDPSPDETAKNSLIGSQKDVKHLNHRIEEFLGLGGVCYLHL